MVDEPIRRLIREPNFAMFTSLLKDGSPQSHVMWVDTDDEHVLINTELHRQKYKNVARDPRVTVTIWDRDDPYRFAEVRGEVVEIVRGDEPRAHIDELSMKYRGHPYVAANIESERVLLKIKPKRQLQRNLDVR